MEFDFKEPDEPKSAMDRARREEVISTTPVEVVSVGGETGSVPTSVARITLKEEEPVSGSEVIGPEDSPEKIRLSIRSVRIPYIALVVGSVLGVMLTVAGLSDPLDSRSRLLVLIGLLLAIGAYLRGRAQSGTKSKNNS